MPFEELDKKIREAAEQYHPAYEDNAWAKMEILLDKHLPVNKKRRRMFIFWFFSLAVLTSVVLFNLINKGNGDKKFSALSVTDTVSGKNSSPALPFEKNIHEGIDRGQKSKTILPANSRFNAANTRWSNITNPKTKKKNIPIPFRKNQNNDIKFIETAKSENVFESQKTGNTGDELIKSGISIETDTQNEKITKKSGNEKVETVVNTQKKELNEVTVPSDSIIKTVSSTSPFQVEKKGKEKGKDNFLFISASMAPDISFVTGNRIGKTKLIAGIGIGYSFKNRFTLQSGFYSGRKVYSATGSSYNPPASFYQYYPILENVNADCMVYEIPVSASYSFGQQNKRRLFVSAGISTLLMKKEKYNYSYKYSAAGRTYTKTREITNENKHFFSIATLSAGYRYPVGRKVLLLAEPYYKFPLGGVGFGKVKLKSSGLLFSVTYRITGTERK